MKEFTLTSRIERVTDYIRPDHEEDQVMQAYCVKCKSKQEMKDPHAITMKNGKPATQGTCGVCGTKMTVIGKSEAK